MRAFPSRESNELPPENYTGLVSITL